MKKTKKTWKKLWKKIRPNTYTAHISIYDKKNDWIERHKLQTLFKRHAEFYAEEKMRTVKKGQKGA